MATLTDANTRFSVDLLKKLSGGNPTGNIFFSPISISTAMSMVSLGASGDTAKQMETVLHFNEITGGSTDMPVTEAHCDKPGGPHYQFKALLSAINQRTNTYELSIANRLYGSDKYEFLQKYLHCTKELYQAELERADFVNATEEARKKINSWVESQTNGKIKDLFSSGSLDQSTILVLVNAIYFKGKWKLEFPKNDTREALFWTDKNQSKKVQMMFQQNTFKLAKIKNPPMQVLELPYDKDEFCMLILLPDNKGAPDQLERELTYAKLQEWTSSANMKEEEMQVFLPRFKLEEMYQLEAPLSALGMTDVFSAGKADLSGMSGNRDLVVSKAVHKSYIEVNEEGTVAAAATGVLVATSSKILPEFRADHPFLFQIRHNPTGSILFLGRYSSP